MVNIKIILGSTRPGRFGIQPATWLMEMAKERTDATFELIDLEQVDLPMLNEPMPAMGKYEQPHTKAWGDRVGPGDGFVFITPEYNHGYPAVLKNAIDYLVAEWRHKPVAFVSYGMHAGGARAVEQLREVVAWLRMYDLAEHVIIPSYPDSLNEAGKWQPTPEQVKQAHTMLDSLVFWAEEMKESRVRLAEIRRQRAQG